MKNLLSGLVGFAIVFAALSCQHDAGLKKNITSMKMKTSVVLKVNLLPLSMTGKVNVLRSLTKRDFMLIPLSAPKSMERKLLKV